MKTCKIIITVCILFALPLMANAQVKTHYPAEGIESSNVFIDASGFDAKIIGNNFTGKGLVVPSVNLVEFEFTDVTNYIADGITFPTFYDGMIVYNNTTGTTTTNGVRSSTAMPVVPGFYYFYNPEGFDIYQYYGDAQMAVAAGVWKPLGGTSVTNFSEESLENILKYITKAINVTVIGDSIANNFIATYLGDTIMKYITKEVNITKLGDSIANYFNQTYLGDTIMKYFSLNISQEFITNISDSIAYYISHTELGDSIMKYITKEVNITKLGNEIANYFNTTNLGDTIMKYFTQNLTKDFVINMGDSIANYFSQTDLRDTVINTINANAWGLNGNTVTAGQFLGTKNAQPVIVKVNNAEVVRIGNASGNIGLEVNGAATNKTAYNAGSGTTIDFSKSNLAYTTANAGNTFTLQNMKDGGTYTLAVQGATSGTAAFTATDITVKIVNTQATVAGKHTLYTIIVMGTTAYVYVASGF